jgi:hypothetical protein
MRALGTSTKNKEGKDILDFAVAFILLVANTFFRTRQYHLVTFTSAHHYRHIDFVLTRTKWWKLQSQYVYSVFRSKGLFGVCLDAT